MARKAAKAAADQKACDALDVFAASRHLNVSEKEAISFAVLKQRAQSYNDSPSTGDQHVLLPAHHEHR
jgi:hypothetical protein